MPVAAVNPAPKKRRSLLPLLTVVFIASYALMTMLIVEQGGVIQQQRNLIKVLQTDSTELWAIKGKAVVDKANRDNVKKNASPGAQAPEANKKMQAPSVPGGQRTQTQAKPHIQLPPVPAADMGDNRRVLITL
jgi:hypothetical protein